MLGQLRSQSAVIQAARDACSRHFRFAMIFSALVNLLFIAPMLYMLQVYDRVIPTQGASTLLYLSLVLAFALGTMAVLDSMRTRLLVRASVRLDRELAPAIMAATLARAELGGQRVARQALREFDILRQALTGPVMTGVFDAPWVPIYILVAFLIHPWIGMLGVAGAAMTLYLAWRNERATHEPLNQANAAAGRAYAGYENSVAFSDVVRALGLRRTLIAGHLEDREAMMRLQTGASLTSSNLSALSRFVRLSLQSVALGLAALLAIEARVSLGAVFASAFIIGRALAPIDQLVGGWKTVVQAMGAHQALGELFAERPDDVALTRLPPPMGKLQAENLTIAAEDRSVILNSVSFTVAAGEMVAIVGPSGAGKSTLVRALAGAIVPSAGTIRFDGADQRNWNPEDLADHIGFMPQEPSLFPGTVKENIARFRNRIDADPASIDEAVVAAAQLAGAHDMILRLPMGYDTPIGTRGAGLSIGQAQRIALARAVFMEPRYVILDEPNANLDRDGDLQLVAMLEELKRRGCTVLMVAHRLSALPIVDTMMVIKDGRLAMTGPRDDVLAKISPPSARVAPVAGTGLGA